MPVVQNTQAKKSIGFLKLYLKYSLTLIPKCNVQSRFEQTLPVFLDVKNSQSGPLQFKTAGLKGGGIVDCSKHLPSRCPWELTVTSFTL
jgi:hypothetical protein